MKRLTGRVSPPAFRPAVASSHPESMPRKFRFSGFSLTRHSRLLGLLMTLILLLWQGVPAQAIQVTLAWDPPATGTVDGYRLFYHLEDQSYDYSHPDWQGSTTTCTISNLQDITTYFVVRAYNADGESGDSNEAIYQPVAAATAAISRNPASLSTSCTQGSNASKQSFQVSNAGSGTLSYSITDNASWLSCSPTSGTSMGEQDTITVNYSTSGLSNGTYSATITITDAGATNSPQVITVSLTVGPSGGTVVLYETLEGTGYVTSPWTKVVSGSSLVDEDYSSSGLGMSGDQVLRIFKNSSSDSSYIEKMFSSSQSELWGKFLWRCTKDLSGGADGILVLRNSANSSFVGTVHINLGRIYAYYAPSTQSTNYYNYSANTTYYIWWHWKQSTKTMDVYVNTSNSRPGSPTASATGTSTDAVRYVRIKCPETETPAEYPVNVYFDNVWINNSDMGW
jgi:Viral BACON domain